MSIAKVVFCYLFFVILKGKRIENALHSLSFFFGQCRPVMPCSKIIQQIFFSFGIPQAIV